jgi:hypothetical protein
VVGATRCTSLLPEKVGTNSSDQDEDLAQWQLDWRISKFSSSTAFFHGKPSPEDACSPLSLVLNGVVRHFVDGRATDNVKFT